MNERIKNWRRVAAQRRWQSADRCRSIESRWKSPQTWYPPEPHFPPDVKDAWAIEDAWRSLPLKAKEIIKYAVIWSLDKRAVCRKVHIHHLRFEESLSKALHMLDNVIRV